MNYTEKEIIGILKFTEEQKLEGLGGIYAIIHNNRWYIGSAKNFEERWSAHKKQISSARHHSIKLKRAIQKYGLGELKFIKLEIVTDSSNLLEREQYWLNLTKAYELGYNYTPTAGSQLGVTASEATKKKMSETRKRLGISPETRAKQIASRKANFKGISEETRERLRQSHLGKTLPEEQKKKIGDALRGRILSDEMKEKLSKAKKGKKFSEEHKKALSEAKLGRRSSRASISDDFASKLKLAIRSRGDKTLKEVAKEYNVKLDTVKRISSGRLWKDLP